MAVKANTARNARRAQMWTEQDDAALGLLIKRKIKDTTIAIRESTSPYETAKLKQQKNHYKLMLKKVERGAYNGDILFEELKASAALRQEQQFAAGLHSNMAGGRDYTSGYNSIDLDYEAALRKKRYYGASLPIIMVLLTLVMIASIVLGILSPSIIPESFSNTVSEGTDGFIDFNKLFVYRLGTYEETTFDIKVVPDADGKWWWPEANYPEGVNPVQGEPLEGYNQEEINLYANLGVTEIYLDAQDIIKAWFRTKMLAKTRLDFLEDLEIFQGSSYYYLIFLSGTKADDLVIKKNEEGNYDFGIILNHIGVYGTILFLIATLILMVILLIINIIRIFTYTSRRLHGITLLCFLFSALTAICPVFATCASTSELGDAFANYFSYLTSEADFLDSTTTSAGVSLMILIPVVCCLLLLILPVLFKNRYKAIPSRIPRGNKKAHL